MQTSMFFIAIAALARVALATPPACLIAALGVQENPADIPTLCKAGFDSLYGNITEACSGDNKASAVSIYSSTCLANGVTISIPTSTASSASPTGTGSGSTAGSSTGPAQTDASATGTAGAPSSTPTGAGSSLSARSSVVLGSVVVLSGLASQLLL